MKKTLGLILLIVSIYYPISAQNTQYPKGNVIFIHPDGTSLSVWNMARILYVGPDSNLNWDLLPNVALYRGHLSNSLTATSNAGGTIHAYGVKASTIAYGLDNNEILTARSGKKMSILKEAMEAGIKTGLVNSGNIVEPGTGAFVAQVDSRGNSEEIAKQIIFSGIDVIMSGGEEWLIPQGTKGIFCKNGKRTDGINLIEEAKKLGYHIIYTREDLFNIPVDVDKLLGVFAEDHTFNDKPEEELIKLGLKNFNEEAPTLAEMTETALRILSKDDSQFILIIEEEGTDNFGNQNNANGMLEALKRADDAIGVARSFLEYNPNTLLITASDSEAGGPSLIGNTVERMAFDKNAPLAAQNGSPIDGKSGTGSLPFISSPDKDGKRFPFLISWSTTSDVYGSVVVRAEGLNSGLIYRSIDNTDIYKFMYVTLFGKLLP